MHIIIHVSVLSKVLLSFTILQFTSLGSRKCGMRNLQSPPPYNFQFKIFIQEFLLPEYTTEVTLEITKVQKLMGAQTPSLKILPMALPRYITPCLPTLSDKIKSNS